MRLLILAILLFAFGAQAQSISLRNDREGKSYYSKFQHRNAIKKVLKKAQKEEVVALFHEALEKQDPRKLCSYSLNEDLQKKISERGLKLNYKGVLYLLRQENEIDDVVTRILLNAYKVKDTSLYQKNEEDLILPVVNENSSKVFESIAAFSERLEKGSCFDEVYRSYHSELLKIDKKLKSFQLETLNYLALKGKRISEEVYKALEQARLNELEKGSLTLAAYHQKIQTLRSQYPLRDSNEQSNFVSEKAKKMRLTRRQNLLENYSDLQIIIMGNIIKTLREDLEAPKVEILVYDRETLDVRRKIQLEPMERFRFAIKFLRKEMAHLSTNTYFAGRSPSYTDLMAASYEIGIIPAIELDEVASLEEIWNPKKTFWDKAGVWIRTFSSIATIVIPPPYGFIPALAIVVIEATAGKKQQRDETGSLF